MNETSQAAFPLSENEKQMEQLERKLSIALGCIELLEDKIKKLEKRNAPLTFELGNPAIG